MTTLTAWISIPLVNRSARRSDIMQWLKGGSLPEREIAELQGRVLTRAHKVPAETLSEIVEDSVSVLLIHAGVYVEARVAQLCDLLGQQFHTLGGVAEDYRLVDLQLCTKGIEAMSNDLENSGG